MAQENNNPDAENPRNRNEIANRPACAACKHQRKRCIKGKCILWSLFPAAETKEFEAVHKLFGISNVTKLILDLNSGEERAEAARTIKYEAMERIRDPVCGVIGEILRLRQKVEMLEGENRQLRHRLQENPLPVHHFPGGVHPHVFDSCSGAWVGNTQQGYGMGNGNYSQVFQNNGYVANNGQLGFDNGVSQKLGMMGNQEIRPCHGVEGCNCNNFNMGLGGYNGHINGRGYDSVRTAEMEARRTGSRNIINGVGQIGAKSGTEKTIHLQGSYNGDNIINNSSSEHARRVYDSGRVVGMEVEGRDGVQLGRSSGAEKSIHHQGEYNGDVSINNCSSVNVRAGYDSGRVVGVEAGNNISNIVNGASCVIVNVGGSSRILQSIHHHGEYNDNNTTNDSSNTNERGDDSVRMVVGTSEKYNVYGAGEDVVQTGGTSRTELSFDQQRGYDSGTIVGMEAAGRNGSNIVNGESGEEGVAQTGSNAGVEQSFQQERGDGQLAGFPPEC